MSDTAAIIPLRHEFWVLETSPVQAVYSNDGDAGVNVVLPMLVKTSAKRTVENGWFLRLEGWMMSDTYVDNYGDRFDPSAQEQVMIIQIRSHQASRLTE
jgi:hypothetical protein